jgi:hypothetical protein
LSTLLPDPEEEQKIAVGCAHWTTLTRILETPLNFVSTSMAETDWPKMRRGGENAIVQVDLDQAGPAIVQINVRDDASGQLDEAVY